eukprot:Skav203726  [mRNA]  locus=scaffold259:626535:637162:- [translate_table: standard]
MFSKVFKRFTGSLMFSNLFPGGGWIARHPNGKLTRWFNSTVWRSVSAGVMRPFRCHHCRVCNICVLRMDHHCPWVYNCIGFRNHKYFILLLIYSAIDLIFITVTMFESVWWSTRIDTHLDVSPALMLSLLFAECFACFLCTAGRVNCLFLGFHGWLTVPRYCMVALFEKDAGCSVKSLVSQGLYENVCAVLGPKPIFWLLPCSLPKGDGLTWQKGESDD